MSDSTASDRESTEPASGERVHPAPRGGGGALRSGAWKAARKARRKSSAEPASISGLVLGRVLGEYLSEQGCDFRSLLRAARVQAQNLSGVDARIGWDDERRLWREAERSTGDPDIGLHAGAHARPPALDALGYAMRSAPTLRDALEAAARYHRFIVSGAIVAFECNHTEGRFSIELPPALIAGSRHPIECAFATLVRICREITRSSFSPRGVSFQHRSAATKSGAPGFFRTAIEYGSARSALRVHARDLALPLATRDPDLCGILERHLGDVLERLPEETAVVARLREDLARALGRESVSLRVTARRLGVGPRTLQRQLLEHGTSFRDVLDDVRRDLALAFVRQANFDSSEIGFLLGFARPSAFYRAFRRWTGGTPREVRARCCRAG